MSRLILVAALAVAAGRPARAPRPTTAEALRDYVRRAREAEPAAAPSAGSLFSPGSPGPYGDFKARRVDDIVVVRVVEATDATAAATTKTDRKAEINAGVPRLLGLESHIPAIKDIVQGSSSSKFNGDGSTQRSSALTTQIAARVVEVLPSGALVIEGSRELAVNRETQRVTLLGLVRPSDIDALGTVTSTQVSDLQVVVEGRGVVADNERPGWLHRFLVKALPL